MTKERAIQWKNARLCTHQSQTCRPRPLWSKYGS